MNSSANQWTIVSEVIAEVASIAASLEDSPIFWKIPKAAEGITAMLQAANAFTAANDDAGRLDAGLWLGEAYLLFSGALPDVGRTEHETTWATASQISKLLGGPEVWADRCRDAFEA